MIPQYNPYYPQQSYQQSFQPISSQQPVYDINWVQGEVGAKAFQMPRNSKTILMDSENEHIFYIKVCDEIGMCTIRPFHYDEVTSSPKSDFVTKTDLRTEVEKIINEMLGGGSNDKSLQTA